jgi:hypothetical protein
VRKGPSLALSPIGAASVALASIVSACGGTRASSFTRDSGAPPHLDATVDAGDRDRSVPILVETGAEGGGCVDHCSADLHDVLDCDDHVVKTCPTSEGCAPGGKCVTPCESAVLNQSSVGCDYYSVVPAGSPGVADGSCFAAYIANTWNGPVALTVQYAGMTIPLDGVAFIPTDSGSSLTYAPLPGGVLPAGELAILFLNYGPGDDGEPPFLPCPSGVSAAATGAYSDTTSIIQGFHISTSVPVAAYDIFPYGGSEAVVSSATLLLPTTAWGTNYLAVDSFAKGFAAADQPFIQIVAAEDGTRVTLNPTVAIVGGSGVGAASMGMPVTYYLNAGQVLQLEQDEELNGTPIQSDKPIGVWGGDSCMNINVDDTACDSGHQQLFPISALGSEYVGVRYRPRDPAQPDEAPPWRVMGVVDGTTLTYDPPTPPPGAPSALHSGQLALFYSAGPFVVKSQDSLHPFYMSAHMGGQNFGGIDYRTGDPEQVNVLPPEEFVSSYIFMTDPTFRNTSLVLIRQKTVKGTFADVSLDCLTGPVSNWSPVGTAGTYEYAWVDLVVSVADAGVPQGSCNNGYHAMTSDAPFGLTVWGWDTYVSYAYPGGGSLQAINKVVVPAVPK